MKYKKISNNENAIEIDGKVVLSFDPRYKKYLKWRDKNPELEEKLIDNLEQEIENKKLYNLGAPHKKDGIWKWYNEKGQLILRSKISPDEEEIQEVDGLFEGTTGEVPKNGLFIEYYESGELLKEGQAYEFTYWHNFLFNPYLSPEVKVLGFEPDWSAASADPILFQAENFAKKSTQ